MVETLCVIHAGLMKHQKNSNVPSQTPASPTRPPAVTEPGQEAVDFAPEPDEVARRAYFSYVNKGAPQGQHVQHWLDAEAELIAERNRTRVHGFHNRT